MQYQPSTVSNTAAGLASPSAHGAYVGGGDFVDDEEQPEFQIGVCDESLRVFAKIIMRGAHGVRRIQSEMVGKGYRSVTTGTSEELRGCDLLLVRQSS